MSTFTIVFLSTLVIGVIALGLVVVGAYRLWSLWRE